jgi:hypothetical protein
VNGGQIDNTYRAGCNQTAKLSFYEDAFDLYREAPESFLHFQIIAAYLGFGNGLRGR